MGSFTIVVKAGQTGSSKQQGGDVATGFHEYGIAVPIAQKAWGGPNTVIDSQGNPLVLLPFILPSNALLVIDARTGETEQFDVDYPEGVHYMRYHVLSADGKRWYTTVGRSLREFDIDKREWTLVKDIPFTVPAGRHDGRGMLEDEEGRLWIIFSPTSELVSYDPRTGELQNHGTLNDENWSQMPDGLAMDDRGWIYAAIKFQKGNLVAWNPETGERRQMIDEDSRAYAAGHNLFRAENGKVYGRLIVRRGSAGFPGQWYEFHDGEAKPVDEPAAGRLCFSQGWKDPRIFKDGSQLLDYSLVRRELVIRDAETGEVRNVPFDYKVRDGANIYSLELGSDGAVYGTTGTPLAYFRLDPETGSIETLGSLGDHGGHVNDMAELNGRIYGAVYSSGSLIMYDPEQPWDEREIRESVNPRHLYGYGEAGDLWGRPYTLLAHPDQKHLVMGGNPSRALTGGGMFIYNTETAESTVVRPNDLVPNQGPMVIKALPNGDLVGGTTTQAGTTGTRVAREAEIFIYDWENRKLKFRGVPISGALEIADLVVSEEGRVYGFTRGRVNAFFVFDPVATEVVHAELTDPYGIGEPAGSQGPRMMTISETGEIYALFREAVVHIDPETFKVTKLADTPITVGAGIVLRNNRIYFTDRVGSRGGSRLWSYELPERE